MSNVKRYDIEWEFNNEGNYFDECEDGDYVKYKDFARLEEKYRLVTTQISDAAALRSRTDGLIK